MPDAAIFLLLDPRALEPQRRGERAAVARADDIVGVAGQQQRRWRIGADEADRLRRLRIGRLTERRDRRALIERQEVIRPGEYDH